MSLFNVFNISGSALSAQSQRMNVTASNLANADSVAGPDGQPYRARQLTFEMAGEPGQQIGGVRVAGISEDQSEFRRLYDPKNPAADDQGYVSMPNVDTTSEMVNMISAARSYQANVEVLNTNKTLMLKTLTLGQ
ncbi:MULTISPECIES: flagellar basal body rod protein FlgC [Kushneria]|uniref:Flagellar basal-body rod protein FlgC n=2 Tax=Kushneria TaxID=504090 RepID=A0A3D9E1K7_9GAMM|nr:MULTISPECIES: flagellar basal body rod protein FlgC [Kushneria]REC96344.1 flagellar basal-body rod protein FlgC [Kushneria indalinina DSM 14324]GHC33562.1 flagellar basal-body rod protein FlgC [Kushneria pakistanensis]